MLEIRKVARRTKSCSKSEKLLKSCRATSGQPYVCVTILDAILCVHIYFSFIIPSFPLFPGCSKVFPISVPGLDFQLSGMM